MHLRNQPIAAPSHPLDVPRLIGGVAQRVAQHHDALRKIFGRYDAPRAPRFFGNLTVLDDARTRLDEDSQQFESEAAKRDGVAAAQDPPPPCIEREIVEAVLMRQGPIR